MPDKSAAQRRGCGALVAVCAAIIPAAANAQNAPTDRIEAIERQMRVLQGEMQQLKSELGEAKQQLRQSRSEAQRSKEEARQAREAAARAQQDAQKAATAESQATQAAAQAQAAAAAPPPAPVAAGKGIEVGFPGGRPTIATTDGRMSLAIGTQTQFDMGTYFQNTNPNTAFPDLNTGVNLRRGRIFFVAKYDDWTFNITPRLRRLTRRVEHQPDLVRSEPELHRVQAGNRHRWLFQAVGHVIRLAELERFPADGATQHHRNLTQCGRRRRPRHRRAQGIHGPIFRRHRWDRCLLWSANQQPTQRRTDRRSRAGRGTPLL
jgi:hypothetical protein